MIDGIKRVKDFCGRLLSYEDRFKTEQREDVVVCLLGERIEHVTEMGKVVGKGVSILVHVGTNNAAREFTPAIMKKYRNLLKRTKQARVDQIILPGILKPYP